MSEWAGVFSDDPAELHGLDGEPPDLDLPDKAELIAIARDLKEMQ